MTTTAMTMTMTDLIDRLAACHRTVCHRDRHAVVEQYLVQCPACDGDRWHLRRPGDADYACQLWREYVAQQSS